MVLTENQKTQLAKDILEYLCNNDYKKSAEMFADEAGLSLADVDSEGKKLQVKWKSILSLQKKISGLDEKVQSLEEELAKVKKDGPMLQSPILEDLYLLKTPPKYQMKGHKSTVTSLAFHPQYTQLASTSEDGSIKIWEFETGDFQRTLKGHTNPVNCVNYDPQGKFLVSSSSDLTIKLWDLNNDYQCCKTFYGHNHNVSFVTFLGSEYIISSSRDKTIKLWQISTGFCKRTYSGHENWVRSVAITQDLKTMVSCSDDQSIIVWNIEKEAPVHRYFAHENVIETLLIVEGEHSTYLMQSEFLKHKFTKQSKIKALEQLEAKGSNGIAQYQQPFLFTASRDKTIRLYLMNSGEHLYTFVGHDNWVRSLALHSTGKFLYSASDDKSIRIWDLNFGKEKKGYQAAHQHFISSLRFNKKYGVVATSGNDMVIRLWHLK